MKELENVKKYKMLEIKARQESKLKEYIITDYYNATCGDSETVLISMCIWYSMDDICDKETVKLQLEYIR